MAGQVPEQVKKARVRRLIDLAEEMAASYRRRFLGSEASVLWERRRADGLWEGLTDTYIRVKAASDADLTNLIAPAVLKSLEEDGLRAEVRL
jgi:threonylcarbamoyladenosine tRNA methylthiotransferase MtaB